MGNNYYEISPGRRKYIRSYLKKSSCSHGMGGYNVLFHVISIAADHPEFNSRRIFEEYSAHLANGDTKNWRKPYNLANYCFQNSVTSSRSLYSFIREAATELNDMSA